VVGAVLAGGSGSRLGGSKPSVELAGRPLVSYPMAALSGASERVVVVCKPDTELPDLPGLERWNEPEEPRHPLTGIVHALERAAAPVLVCAADMPFVTPDACLTLLQAATSSPPRWSTCAERRPTWPSPAPSRSSTRCTWRFLPRWYGA
jgi:molybdopterin-guanine dinucleotide biosynthesis protein A